MTEFIARQGDQKDLELNQGQHLKVTNLDNFAKKPMLVFEIRDHSENGKMERMIRTINEIEDKQEIGSFSFSPTLCKENKLNIKDYI